MNYDIFTLTTFGELDMHCHTRDEQTAEEVGAALALAGFEVQVYCDSKLLHEFFPS